MKYLVDGLVLFIFAFWQVYMEVIIIDLMFNVNSSNKQKVIFTLIISIVSTIQKLFLPADLTMIQSITFLALLFLGSKLILKLSLSKSIISSLLAFALLLPVEIVSSFIGFQLLKLPNTITYNVFTSIPIFLIINLWFTIIAYAFNKLKKKNYFSKLIVLNSLDDKYIFINLVVVILVILPNILFYTTNQYNYPLPLLVYNILANLLLVTLSIFNTYKLLELNMKEKDLKNADLYNKHLLTLVDSVRVFKHDYNTVY